MQTNHAILIHPCRRGGPYVFWAPALCWWAGNSAVDHRVFVVGVCGEMLEHPLPDATFDQRLNRVWIFVPSPNRSGRSRHRIGVLRSTLLDPIIMPACGRPNSGRCRDVSLSSGPSHRIVLALPRNACNLCWLSCLCMLERQREGIAKAKAAGKYKGRPVSIDAAQIRQLRAELGPAAIAKRLGIARSSVYRALG